jgi:hypothetical protein
LEECRACGDGDEVTLTKRRDVVSATENKKLMEDIFAAIAAGNRSMLLDSLADDVTMRVTGQIPGRGRSKARRRWCGIYTVI